MKIPESLAAALAAADDNYLIGLCNKGTVNRGKKDLAAAAPEAVTDGGGVTVKLGDVACTIRAPLGESRCSCPSSTMCRHRIAAIIWLRQNNEATAEPAAEPQKPEFQQLRSYPAEKLAKQLGPKRLSAALFRHRAGEGPVILETSVITVEMPWHPATVKLLEPLEHSTCTCHSKTFCPHKAEALLYWQLSRGIVLPEALETAGPDADFDIEEIRGVCRAVQEALTAQMVTGLSRMPPSVCETVERMAALCHTAKLPELERALRNLHGEYAAYFGRSATYRDAALLTRLSRAFRLAAALEQADAERLPALAGTFREEYSQVGDLSVYLLGYRDFSGRSGYAGTIYYFWERKDGKYYTFSDIRPTFYETNRPRRRSEAAPWGLPCTMRQAWNCAMDLSGAKANRTGNLSSTEQCRATLLGPINPGAVIPAQEIFTDFSELFARRSAPHRPETERLAVILPHRWEIRTFDRVQQVFSMRLLDRAGRDLWLEVRYKKEEAAVVDLLERLSAALQKPGAAAPVFFGIVYREGERLKCYPIEYFTEWEGNA